MHTKLRAYLMRHTDYTVWRDYLYAPLYLYQALKLHVKTVRLPEAAGARSGRMVLCPLATDFNVIMLGDSVAAGVGVAQQADGFMGQLLAQLSHHQDFNTHFGAINWQLLATSGHHSLHLLQRLDRLSPQHIDCMIINVGVNDIIARFSHAVWQYNLGKMIEIAQQKFAVNTLIFMGLPPMQLMPALPHPLKHFVAARALQFDEILKKIVMHHHVVHYCSLSHAEHVAVSAETFASDGFHPSATGYRLLAHHVMKIIQQRFLVQ